VNPILIGLLIVLLFSRCLAFILVNLNALMRIDPAPIHVYGSKPPRGYWTRLAREGLLEEEQV
jgi:hypothetical protein